MSDITDEYFNRAAQTVAGKPQHKQPVRYQVFARRGGVLCGIERAVAYVESGTSLPLTVRAAVDGDLFDAAQAVMVIEGAFGELVELETTYLGMLSLSAAAGNMARIVAAAGNVPVIDMSPRHYPHEIIEQIAYASAVGGGQGTSTRAGYEYVHQRCGVGSDMIRIGQRKEQPFGLYGSIPHALNAVYDGNSVDSAAAHKEAFPDTPLTVLIDFEGRELDVCTEAYKRLGDDFFAVRLDTHGGRVHQGGHAAQQPDLVREILARAESVDDARLALERYGFGPGVTIEAAYNVRRHLDRIGATNTKLLVSSGFDANKVAAFAACKTSMDGIGTGSWVEFLMFTSDITHVYENGQWVDRCKVGRSGEIKGGDNLPLRVQRD